MPDAKVQRTSGRVNRTGGRVIRATVDDLCCCAGGETWWSIQPCGININGWWACPFAATPDEYYLCRWITDARLQELYAQAAAGGHAPGTYGIDNLIVYDSVSAACYRVTGSPVNVVFGAATVPGGGFNATTTISYLGVGVCCDFCHCDPPDNPDPPVDPPPPPPPPASCPDCGATAICGNCTCTPDYGIRVTITGWTACACIGPCGNFPSSYYYAALAAAQVFNGVFDLARVDLCTWQLVVGRTLSIGDQFTNNCSPSSTTAFTLHLQKLSLTQWVFTIYVYNPDPTDPRLNDNTNDDPQFRAFSGIVGGDASECMTIGPIVNTMTCGCRATATSDGRFDIGHGGIATFTILCA